MNNIYAKSLAEGMRLVKEGNPNEAVNRFVFAAQYEEFYSVGHYQAGLASITLGRFQDALDNIDKSLCLEPNLRGALARKCFTLAMLERCSEAYRCLEKANNGLKGHHYAYQFWDLVREGYPIKICPNFKTSEKPTFFLDTSICMEILRVGNLRNTPHILEFIEHGHWRVAITETVMSEVLEVTRRKDLQAGPHVLERLEWLKSITIKPKAVKVVAAYLSTLKTLYRGIIAEGGATCRAWWDAKGHNRVMTDAYGRVIIPDMDVLEALYAAASTDRMIIAEVAALSAVTSGPTYLVTADFDISLFAAMICRITGGKVMPVRPEQIV